MRHNRVGLVAALESEQEFAAAIALKTVGNNADSLETEMLETDSCEAVSRAIDQELENAFNVTEALESIAVALESSFSDGGLSRDGANAVSVSVNHLYRSVNIAKRSMPSLESFSIQATRIRATQLAMEDLSESIKKIWEAICAGIKKAIEWVAEFFIKIFRGADYLKKRAEHLKKAANANKGAIKEKTIENEHLANALQINGVVITNIHANVNVFSSIVHDTFSASKNHSKAFAASFTKMFGDNKFINGEAINGLIVYKGDYKSNEIVHNPESLGFPTAPKDLVFVRSPEMFGGKTILGPMPDRTLNGEELYEVIDSISLRVGDFDPKASKSTLKTLPTMNAEDAGYVANELIKIADELLGYKSLHSQLSKIKRDFNLRLLKINVLVKNLDEDGRRIDPNHSNKKINQYVTNNKQAARFFVRMIEQPATSMASYALRTGKALCDYIEESLKRLDDNASAHYSGDTGIKAIGMRHEEPETIKPEYTKFKNA